jgi:hypothetical protein
MTENVAAMTEDVARWQQRATHAEKVAAELTERVAAIERNPLQAWGAKCAAVGRPRHSELACRARTHGSPSRARGCRSDSASPLMRACPIAARAVTRRCRTMARPCQRTRKTP